MISSMKKSRKRIWSGIAIVAFSIIISLIFTKVIYDGTFCRYDVVATVPAQLNSMVEERETPVFKSGKNQLCGYLYNGTGDGLVVIVPGYRAGADDYIWQINELNLLGYGVFSFDATGSCRSEGEDAVGFAQTVNDLECALSFIEENDRFGYERIYLLGHSRGAYAVCSVLDSGYDITAAVSISGVNSCMEAVIQPAADKVGFVAYGNYPFLWLYQALLFGGETTSTDAAEEIIKSNVPTLVVQGASDNRYTEEKYSVYSHLKDKECDNVSCMLMTQQGQDGHTSLLFDADGTANDLLINEIHRFFEEADNM